MLQYTATKTYRNLPCSHRAWRHPGHCRFIHGYSRSFSLQFGAVALDECGFVVDFGSLKPLKALLDHLFDHTMLINADDPERATFEDLHARQIVDLRVLTHCGMEGSARLVWALADSLVRQQTGGRAWCFAVEARENDKNAATYMVDRHGTEPSTMAFPSAPFQNSFEW